MPSLKSSEESPVQSSLHEQIASRLQFSLISEYRRLPKIRRLTVLISFPVLFIIFKVSYVNHTDAECKEDSNQDILDGPSVYGGKKYPKVILGYNSEYPVY